MMWNNEQTGAPKHTHEQHTGFSAAHASDGDRQGNIPSVISQGISVKGEISGTDPLLIEGRAEGGIYLEGGRVTVGRNGLATANIVAREIVVQGKVCGNITASDRVDVRAEASVVGDLTAPRVSIEDGAFFKGGIDVCQSAPAQKSFA